MSALSFDQTAPRSTGATLEWLVGAANNDVPFDAATYAQPVLGVSHALTTGLGRDQTDEGELMPLFWHAQAANNHIQFLNTPASAPGEA